MILQINHQQRSSGNNIKNRDLKNMPSMHWEKLWREISVGKTPSTTPIDEHFWSLLPKHSTILEVGCGWGRIVFECLKRGYNVVGIDINKNEVEFLKKKLSGLKINKKVEIFQENILSTSFKDNMFSATIMQGVLSALHKDNRNTALCEIHRTLAPLGYIHIAEFEFISNDPLMQKRYKKDKVITKELGTLSIRNNLGQELYRTHNFKKDELVKIVTKNKFNIISLSRCIFLSYHGNKKPGILIIAQKV